MNRPFALDAAEDYRTKATLGITGWLCLRVHIDGTVRHLDVGSTYPGAGEGPKGLAVRQLKSYASWVQTVKLSCFLKIIFFRKYLCRRVGAAMRKFLPRNFCVFLKKIVSKT